MKHPDKQLTTYQKGYVIKNYERLSALEMARNLHAPVHRIRIFLDENELEAVTPPQWNGRKEPVSNGFFNVDERKGEYTWVV